MACLATSFTKALIRARLLKSSAMVKDENFWRAWSMLAVSFFSGLRSSFARLSLTYWAAWVS